ncbi:MAG: HEAT repeat domain-containing protein [Acidobacteria bacterium]|nr:HEAT repeat domain-containing protein [Acidobacteriota bacterium]
MTDDGRPLSRLLWRCGERRLAEALPSLLKLDRSGQAMTDYCLAWALGRCGGEDSLPLLQKLRDDPSGDEKVRRMAREAYRAASPPEARQRLVLETIGHLPDPLPAAATSGSAETFRQALSDRFGENALPPGLLEDFYTIDTEAVRPALLDLLRRVPLSSGYFRQLRHIFKAAEFRLDAEVFGLLAYRFEKESATVGPSTDHAMLAGKWVSVQDEIRKPDSRLAYTRATRHYLRGRVWRTLRRLGLSGDTDYARMAVGVLLPFSDADAVKPYRKEFYDWKSRQTRQLDFDGFAPYHAFNHILYGAGRSHEQKRWLSPWNLRGGAPVSPDEREESFPAVWDQEPGGLFHLLMASRCLLVHEFAARALRANPRYLETLETRALVLLLTAPYACTNQLGLDLALARHKTYEPDFELVLGLLASPLPAARETAAKWVSSNSGPFLANLDFLARLMASPQESSRRLARDWIGRCSFSAPQASELCRRLTAVIAAQTEPVTEGVIEEISGLLFQLFPSQLRTLPLEDLLALLDHPLPQAAVFASQVLLGHQSPPEDLPESLLTRLIRSPHAAVRCAGIRLFGSLPLELLLQRESVILEFCLSPLEDVRQAIRPTLARLAAGYPEFGRLLAQTLALHLLGKETAEGFHRDLAGILENELAGSLEDITRDTTVRLLRSSEPFAREFGGFLLNNLFSETAFPVRETIRFANHDTRSVREFAWRKCRENLAALKREMGQTVRLLDSKWEDTREFGFTFIRENFDRDDLPSAALVALCDSVRPEVQRFGCELITSFLQPEAGPDYLLRLSEHPSANLQLFVTNYLEGYASGNPRLIADLRDYFITVLSRVNTARVAKGRIYHFLQQEARKDPETACTVAEIAGRVSATRVSREKAQCLAILRDIREAFPDIPLPLRILPFETRQRQSHGV